MKICARCGNLVQDTEEFCTRCGGTNFTQQQNGQGQLQQRPMQGQPQPQMRPNMQGQQMNNGYGQPQGQPQQRPMQGQPQQRPMQGQPQQQMRPNMQGQPQQRPMKGQGQPQPQQQMNNGYGQQQMNGYGQQQMNSGYNQQPQNQAPIGSFDNTGSAFSEEPPAKKKGKLNLGKKNQNQQNQNMQANNQYGSAQNNFMAEQPSPSMGEDGSSVKDWVITYLIMMVPILNIITLFFGVVKGTTIKGVPLPQYKATWFKAMLVLIVAVFVISILMSVLMVGSIVSMLG